MLASADLPVQAVRCGGARACIQPFHSSVCCRLSSTTARALVVLVHAATSVSAANTNASTSRLYACAQRASCLTTSLGC